MSKTWREELKDKIPADVADDINAFESEVILKKQGKIMNKVFMESRGRRGIYGQRYDNALRHDGKKEIQIPYPGEWDKGPNIHWHAPGMQRIKIPHGNMSCEQLELLADLAEEYGDAILHVTTRQDIQVHFIHIDDTPDIFRRLAAVGITTKEACGNSVRNVTACPLSGVCHTEEFDVTSYAHGLTYYLLGHDDVQDFGRKFKIAFSGCADKPCALTGMHDLGFIARTKMVDGQAKRGFSMYVGGGLGAVPHQAKLLQEFVEEAEILPMTQAVCRIFARYGEKDKRSKARIKFLVKNMGIDEFREKVLEERKGLKEDPRWAPMLEAMRSGKFKEEALKKPGAAIKADPSTDFGRWLATNVEPQVQEGYSFVTINLPLGDLTSNQARDLSDVVAKYVNETMRTTVQQNIALRWVSNDDLEALYNDLKKIGLGDAGAGTILDVTSCPGTDTCKLGVSASRGLAAVLSKQLAEKSYNLDQSVSDLRIKISGCFNSCSMHHIADIGFYGVSRQQGEYVVPHFQMVLGGRRAGNASAHGLAIASLPSKAIPEAVDRLTDYYAKEREKSETFQEFVNRKGKVELKGLIDDLRKIPDYLVDKSYYIDWGNVREFSTGDKTIGECSGEIISLTGMGLKNADREVFDAQVLFDKGDVAAAGAKAFASMVHAAQALLKDFDPDMGDDPDQVMNEFKSKVLSTDKFLEQNANYFLAAFDEQGKELNKEQTHHRIEEAQLFIEESYSFDIKRAQEKGAAAAV